MSSKLRQPPTPTPVGDLVRGAIAAHARGDGAAAEAMARQALRLAPDHPPALNVLAVVANDGGRFAEAERLLRRAIAGRADRAAYHHNLGNARRGLGDRDGAVAAWRRALVLEPHHPGALVALALLHAEDGDLQRARELLREAVAARPELAEGWCELGRVERLLGRPAAAVAAQERALALRPTLLPALVELAGLFQQSHQAQRAQPLLARAAELAPDEPVAHFNLAQVHAELGQDEAAAASYRRVLELAPRDLASWLALAKHRRDRCDWSRWQEETERLAALGADEIAQAPPPFLLNLWPVPPAVHQRVAAACAHRFARQAAHAGALPPRPAREDGRVRVAYLSADFRHHPVGHLAHRLFEHHDREHVEVYAYSLVPVDDEVTAAVRRGCDVFRGCARLSDAAIASALREDGVDVLVDLTGYTTYSRTGVAALRPADLQVQFLGYVNTTAAPFFDATVVDRHLVGAAQRAWFTEATIVLPDCFLPVSPLDALGPPPSAARRADHDLPENVPVLASFNAPHKLDPPAFDAWCAILREVPEAVLWLYDAGRPALRENLAREAAARDVDPARLRFAGALPYLVHLRRLALADLFLDSFAYNAGSTAVDALRAGVPVLTLPGDAPLARMGTSLLHAAGLAAFVAGDAAELVRRGVALAADPGALASARGAAAAAVGSHLFDLARWVRGLEAGLLTALAASRAGRLGDVTVADLPAGGGAAR